MAQKFYERYSRQELIKNWDQSKLTNSRVVVIGDGFLSEFINLALVALGIGEVRIVSHERIGKNDSSFLNKLKNGGYKGNEKAKVFSYALKNINPTIKIIDINTKIFDKNYFVLFNNPDIIIDSTDDITTKRLCADFCKENNVDFIAASAGGLYGLVDINPDESKLNEHSALEGQNQNKIISEILGGFVADEVRKILMPLNNNEKVCKKTLRYSLKDNERF